MILSSQAILILLITNKSKFINQIDINLSNFDSLELFTPFEERGVQQLGGKKYKKCPKCKKHPYHGGKCFICGFIPFLGKTQKRKRGKGKSKKTRKNKRRFSRRRS